MKKRIIGKQYLKKINKISEFKSEYQCLICLSKNIYLDSAILKKEYLTCGCIRSKKKNEEYYTLNRNGTIISFGGFDLSSKMAKGYLGFKGKYLHRLIAEKFIPNNNNYTDINHINGIKTDNKIENLEWCTRSYNLIHAYKIGLKKNKKMSRLYRKTSEKQKKEIINSDKNNKELSKIYNVSETEIGRIRGIKDKSVLQFDLENNFIKEYKNASIATKQLKLKSSSHISSVCRGERKQAAGFIWKIKDKK